MSKAILISIKPKGVLKIFNDEKISEIRKSAPKEWMDYLKGKTDKKPEPCEVYIYCADDGEEFLTSGTFQFFTLSKKASIAEYHNFNFNGNGKVVAKFILREVTDIGKYAYAFKDDFFYETLKNACLTSKELSEYANMTRIEFEKRGMKLYAWGISDLQIFDKPKDVSEFFHGFKQKNNGDILFDYDNEALRQRTLWGYEYSYPLKKAPQSWCYVEVRE